MRSFSYDFFDVIHDRNNTDSIKYSAPANIDADDIHTDIIPMWIADMDFKVPPAVEEALIKTSKHGIFGYTDPGSDYSRLVTSWYKRRMNWEIKSEWILRTPGVIFAIAAALNALTEPGDSVLICQPVYYPFSKIIPANNRRLVISELKSSDGRYTVDFADIEEKIRSEAVKVFLLCSPHNPVGRVWTKEELSEIGRLCNKYDVYIISDEIHSDFIYAGNRHIPIASLSDELAERTITCTSPTKSFNLAGLQAANIIISNPQLRRKMDKACASTGYSHLNTMAIAATKAAYKHGEEWLDTLMAYLQNNVALLRDACLRSEGKLSLIEPEGTYLMWIDCRGIDLSGYEPDAFFIKHAGVWLHNGATFGKGGDGFVRMNIACPRAVLSQALERIFNALGSRI